MSEARRILVTGSSGFIGDALVRGLARCPEVEQILGLDVRAPDEAAALPDKFTYVHHDLRESPRGRIAEFAADTVIHTAFIVSPIRDQAHMEDVNLGGGRRLLAACRETPPRQLIWLSSATAYGFWADNPNPLLETSPLRADESFPYASHKRILESDVEEFRRASPGVAVTVLRPSFVVGPGIDNPLAHHLRKRFPVLVRRGAPIQLTHIDDLTEIFRLIVQGCVAGIFNVGAPGSITMKEMARRMERPIVGLPLPWLKGFNTIAWKLRLKCLTCVPSSALSLFSAPWIVNSDLLEETLGFAFRYDTQETFAEFLAQEPTDRRILTRLSRGLSRMFARSAKS